MQIDPASKLNFNRPLSTPKKGATTKRTSSGSVDSSLKTEYAEVIGKALESDKTDPQIIQQAKDALESGQLDSAEAAEAAAENIVEFGI